MNMTTSVGGQNDTTNNGSNLNVTSAENSKGLTNDTLVTQENSTSNKATTSPTVPTGKPTGKPTTQKEESENVARTTKDSMSTEDSKDPTDAGLLKILSSLIS